MRRPLLLAGLALLVAAPSAHATFRGGNGKLVTATKGSEFFDEDGGTYRQLITLPALGKGRGRGGLVLRECREGEPDEGKNNCDFQYRSPAWAPSGRRLVFDAGRSLALLRSNGSNASGLRKLPAITADDGQPAFSPSGKRLVLSGRAGGGRAIYTARASGATARRIAKGTSPDWSTRNRIAYVRGGAIWSVRPDGRGRRRLTPGRDPSWSPSGKSIAFVRRGGVYVARADGSRVRRVVRGRGCRTPAFSPNGKLLAYDRKGLKVARASDGKLLRRVIDDVPGSFDASEPDWQPR